MSHVVLSCYQIAQVFQTSICLENLQLTDKPPVCLQSLNYKCERLSKRFSEEKWGIDIFSTKRDVISVERYKWNYYKWAKVCKFHSSGFFKRGLICLYYHLKQDSKEHTESGRCLKSVCHNWHRQDCWFYKSRKGFNNKIHCSFLHR